MPNVSVPFGRDQTWFMVVSGHKPFDCDQTWFMVVSGHRGLIQTIICFDNYSSDVLT